MLSRIVDSGLTIYQLTLQHIPNKSGLICMYVHMYAWGGGECGFQTNKQANHSIWKSISFLKVCMYVCMCLYNKMYGYVLVLWWWFLF